MEGKHEKKDAKYEKKVYPVVASAYKLMEEIGRGVSAIVYRARCIPLNEFVAIKALDLERCNSSLDNIRREAQTMSLISHPNVVKAYCSFVVDQSLWVVMPYMSGGSCLHIMKAAYPDGFEEAVIASFLKETLKALEYLHHQGHIHRDVKAGNILVDSNGAVKLADFGVAACMFDTGDRQRSRSTFVGTPCWMAPEVMEQVHGYDFKADIWSFGITALELAHGHAPFSKYPPMKVLLMTLQNAPPGLDYERDKKFSKSFKEMIAMCLVKDPTKRPSSEKLLKHSFFKHARSAEYISRTILGPLPPLWDRVHDLKMKDAVRLAQKKMPYGEQEERSQNEYKRGVSSWNFDVEDLKAQAALDDADPVSGREEAHLKASDRKDIDHIEVNQASSPPPGVTQDADTFQQPVTIHSSKTEGATDVGESATRLRSGPSAAPAPSKALNESKSGHVLTGKKEPKHIGRFDVFEDDPDQDSTDSPDVTKKLQQNKSDERDHGRRDEDNGHKKVDKVAGVGDEKEQGTEHKRAEDRIHGQEHFHRVFSGASVVDSADDVKEVDREIQTTGMEDARLPQPLKEKSFSGPLTSSGAVLESWSSNGASGSVRPTGGPKDSSDEKLKGPLVQKKGRFSVISDDMDLQEDVPPSNARKNASVQTSVLHKSASVGDGLLERRNAIPPPTQPSPAASVSTGGLNASMFIQQLQNLLNHTTIQQELIVDLMNNVNPSEQHTAYRSSGLGTRNISRSTAMSSMDSVGEPTTDRERELLAQVAELQSRVITLTDELQIVKSRNVQLERQLNAIFNKEEEERIRREEAARDDG